MALYHWHQLETEIRHDLVKLFHHESNLWAECSHRSTVGDFILDESFLSVWELAKLLRLEGWDSPLSGMAENRRNETD